jgi:hypothetical protein|tara:strand:+ start:150 stop:383 length:234 start_codon:yes stop_codon:yes gene_type:complete
MAKPKRKSVKTTKEPSKHLQAATEALEAVLTGYRLSHDQWTGDIDKANVCLNMAFNKNDKVFDLSKFLLRRYGKESL